MSSEELNKDTSKFPTLYPVLCYRRITSHAKITLYSKKYLVLGYFTKICGNTVILLLPVCFADDAITFKNLKLFMFYVCFTNNTAQLHISADSQHV